MSRGVDAFLDFTATSSRRASASSQNDARANGVPRLALGVEEAAASIGVSRAFFDEHIAPELRWVRRGRRKIVAVAELDRWLERSGALTLGGGR